MTGSRLLSSRPILMDPRDAIRFQRHSYSLTHSTLMLDILIITFTALKSVCIWATIMSFHNLATCSAHFTSPPSNFSSSYEERRKLLVSLPTMREYLDLLPLMTPHQVNYYLGPNTSRTNYISSLKKVGRSPAPVAKLCANDPGCLSAQPHSRAAATRRLQLWQRPPLGKWPTTHLS